MLPRTPSQRTPSHRTLSQEKLRRWPDEQVASGRERPVGQHAEASRQDEATRVHTWTPSRREARRRHARAGRQHRDLRGWGVVTVAVRKYKPTTPGRRGGSVSTFDEITRSTPEKALLTKGRKKAGRNVHGRITTRHQGGGTKRRYRLIDFKRNKDGIPAKVATIEYDPNRSSRIALLHYADGE